MRTISIVLVLVLAGCCADALKQAQENVRVNRRHEANEALPDHSRLIAQDNGDAWEAQQYLVGGDEPSAEVRARNEARAKAKAAALAGQ